MPGTWAKRQAARPGALPQWILDEKEMIDNVVRKFPELAVGEVKQLMAGTSSGKTTRLPLALANAHGMVVVVLQPSQYHCLHSVSYVREVARTNYPNCTVAGFTSQHVESTATVPTVFFAAVGDFLALYASHPEMIKKVGISCIILDESHENTPPYAVFPYLVQLGLFAETKVLYASATAAGDISAENHGRRVVTPVAPTKLPKLPAMMTTDSPAYGECINEPSVVFVASDEDAGIWAQYYRSFDIPVTVFGYGSGRADLVGLAEFFDKPGPKVLLTTSVFETTYTFPLSCAYDTGYTTRMVTETEPPAVRVVSQPVTASQRVQRAGRCGRMGTRGRAWFADVSCARADAEDDVDKQIYQYLWLRMFNIDINRPSVKQWDALFGTFSNQVIATLLILPLPPLMAIKYLADDGFYQGFRDGFVAIANRDDLVRESLESNETKVRQDWAEYSLPKLTVGGEEISYRAGMSHPPVMGPMLAHIWLTYVRQTDPDFDCGVTIRQNPTVRRAPARRRSSSAAVPVSSTLPLPRKLSGMSMASLTEGLNLSGLDYVRPAVSPVVEEPEVTRSVKGHIRQTSAPLRQLPSGSVVAQPPPAYVDEQPLKVDNELVRAWERGVENKVGSESTDPDEYHVKAVSPPSKYWRTQLVPVHKPYWDQLHTNPVAGGLDKDRVDRVLAGRTNLSDLGTIDGETLTERKAEYFLSILRVHNASAIETLQQRVITSSEWGRRRKLPFWSENMNKRLERSEELARATAKILDIFETWGFHMGIDSALQHANRRSGSGYSFPAREVEAMVCLEKGSELVRESVERIIGCAVPVFEVTDDYSRVVGNGWAMGNYMITAEHVWSKCSRGGRTAWATDTVGDPFVLSEVLYIAVDSPYASGVTVREPREEEWVYVISWVTSEHAVKVHGIHQLKSVVDEWTFKGAYGPGFSGALTVSVEDGAVVGMYLGVFAARGDEKFAQVVPIRI